VGTVFYCCHIDDRPPNHGHTQAGAANSAQLALDDARSGAYGDAWPHDVEDIEWGIALPLEVCRPTETRMLPHDDWPESSEYALVDPDTYDGEEIIPGHCDGCDDCEDEETDDEETDDAAAQAAGGGA
jgi:hypothetical protein